MKTRHFGWMGAALVAVLLIAAPSSGQKNDQAELALKQDENDGHAYIILGQAFSSKRDTEEAVKKFSRATLLVPEEPEPWLMLAEEYQKHQ